MKYVFVDMDGVIAEYGYPNGLYDGNFQQGNYLNKKPVQVVINEILKRFSQDSILIVCSASPCSQGTMEKNDWLDKYFKVPYENRIFISPNEDKVEVIKYYVEVMAHRSVQTDTVIIDDKGTILAKAKALGIECFHPTQLLAQSIKENSFKETKSTITTLDKEE